MLLLRTAQVIGRIVCVVLICWQCFYFVRVCACVCACIRACAPRECVYAFVRVVLC